MTLDGKIATSMGHSAWVSSPASRQQVFESRARSDAVIVGGQTVRLDNPRLTTRREGGHMPMRIVMSRTLDLQEVIGHAAKISWLTFGQKRVYSRRHSLLASIALLSGIADHLGTSAAHCCQLSVYKCCSRALSTAADVVAHGVAHALHKLSLCQAMILLLWKHGAGLAITGCTAGRFGSFSQLL